MKHLTLVTLMLSVIMLTACSGRNPVQLSEKQINAVRYEVQKELAKKQVWPNSAAKVEEKVVNKIQVMPEYVKLLEDTENKWSLIPKVGISIPTGDFEKRGTFVSLSLRRKVWGLELSHTASATDECGQNNVDLEWFALTFGPRLKFKNVMAKNDYVLTALGVGVAMPQYDNGVYKTSGSTEGEGNMRQLLKECDVNGINGVNTGPNWFQNTSRDIRSAPVVDLTLGYGIDFEYGDLILMTLYRYLRAERNLKAWNDDGAKWVSIKDKKYDKFIPIISYSLPFSDIKRMFKR